MRETRIGPLVMSVDVGSTFTKGALISVDEDRPAIIGRAIVPTSKDELERGLLAVTELLLREKGRPAMEALGRGLPVHFSSSAKGGLRIAAIGLVSEMTLDVARITALSAGARVVGGFSFNLTRRDVEALERLDPDIILFAGGTDGGDELHVLHNAAALRDSSVGGTIVYAGNAAAADRIAALLSRKKTMITENVMPDIGSLNADPARELIRSLFLREIIAGKGLSKIAARLGTEPKPTPLAVLELVEAISRQDRSWRDFMVIDLGGATTDVYSNSDPRPRQSSVVLKGIPEPNLKRTVEGDLGLRVTASALYETAGRDIAARARRLGYDREAVETHVRRVHAETGLLAETPGEKDLDLLMAEACVRHSIARHAGRLREVFVPAGRIFVQKGKDLRKIRRIIGTGGFLAGCEDARAYTGISDGAEGDGSECLLLPEAPDYYRDAPYLFPLLGNIAVRHPRVAVTLALHGLEKVAKGTAG